MPPVGHDLFETALAAVPDLMGRVGRQMLACVVPPTGASRDALLDYLRERITTDDQGPSGLAGTLASTPGLTGLPELTFDELVCALMRSWMLADIANWLQRALPDWAGSPEAVDIAYGWRVLDDAANALLDQVQHHMPADYVATPYGVATQPEALQALRDDLLDRLARGGEVHVWRANGCYGNRPQWSSFWTLGCPDLDLTNDAEVAAYLFTQGVRADNLHGTVYLSIARLVAGCRLVVRPAPAFGGAPGGGIEAVTTWDGVEQIDTEAWRTVRRTMLAALRPGQPPGAPSRSPSGSG